MDAGSVGALALRLAVAGGVATTVVAARRGRRPLTWLVAALVVPLTVATAALGWALVAGDFDLTYVADTTDRAASWPFRLAALWGGMDGSLLFWTWLLAVVGTLGALLVARRLPTLLAPVVAVSAAAPTAFALVGLTLADPFRRLDLPALDGAGLSPVLRHPAMLYHPPLLYLGLVACTVPFAVALFGPATDDWRHHLRAVSAAAWVLLTIGLVAGAHWAYVELGWGGYWAWDPIENAGLLPWLGLTALVHLAGDRRSSPRLLAGLAVAVEGLALTGALVTRSGAADSVHAFAEAAAIGRALLAILVVAVVGGAVMVARRPASTTTPPPLLLTVAVVALGAALVIGLGTLEPVVARALGAGETAVDGTYFARYTAPLGLATLLLLGGSVRSWRRHLAPALVVAVAATVGVVVGGLHQPFALAATPLAAGSATVLVAEAVARRRLSAALVAHLGFVVLLAGVAGSAVGTTRALVLPEGGRRTMAGYTVVHEGVATDRRGDEIHVGVTLGLRHGGRRVSTLHPERVALVDRGLVVAETALRSTPWEDVLVAVRRVDTNGTVLLDVTVRPLVQLVWWGALLVILGAGASALSLLRSATTASGRAAARPSPGAGPVPWARAPAEVAAGAGAPGPGGGAATAGSAPATAGPAGPPPPTPSAPAG